MMYDRGQLSVGRISNILASPDLMGYNVHTHIQSTWGAYAHNYHVADDSHARIRLDLPHIEKRTST